MNAYFILGSGFLDAKPLSFVEVPRQDLQGSEPDGGCFAVLCFFEVLRERLLDRESGQGLGKPGFFRALSSLEVFALDCWIG